MALKVIGVGFGRTGTHSLKLALEILGFHKCYHMEELVMHHPEKVHYWEDAREGKKVNWTELFEGYQAAVDFPVNMRYKELMKYYPDAKFILTTRDPESWYKSFGDTIVRQARPSVGKILSGVVRMIYDRKFRLQMKVFRFAGAYLKTMFPNGFDDKPAAIARFNSWNSEVRQTIPRDQLLEFHPKDGWGPLCSFLGVEVPDVPFPQSNTTDEFNKRKL